METQIHKRTVLTDELETELNARCPNEWSFEVRETTCAADDCHCELIAIIWSSPFDDPIRGPLIKIFNAEEIRRRKSMSEYAQATLKQLEGMNRNDSEETDDNDNL